MTTRPTIHAQPFPIPPEVGDDERITVWWNPQVHHTYRAGEVREGRAGGIGWTFPPEVLPPPEPELPDPWRPMDECPDGHTEPLVFAHVAEPLRAPVRRQWQANDLWWSVQAESGRHNDADLHRVAWARPEDVIGRSVQHPHAETNDG